MFVSTHQVRVRYAETDQMNIVYYGNYARYYEIGRVEALRSLDFHYKAMEDEGVMMPVYENRSKYLKPARYDEEITINVSMAKMPGVKIHFKYDLYNEKSELIHVGETLLAFINMKTNRPSLPPQEFLEKLKPFFE